MASHNKLPLSISSHVLNTTSGRPAQGIVTVLEVETEKDKFTKLAHGITDKDGRVGSAAWQIEAHLPELKASKNVFRVTFFTEPYFAKENQTCFYPYVQIVFIPPQASEHYHIPLLLSPFGYSTYRGS